MAATTPDRRFAFTKRGIENLPSSESRQAYYDTKTRHLLLRVARRKVFSWYGKVSGRPKRIKLGVFPDMSVENARKAAQRISGRVAQGLPPVDKPDRNNTTLGELFGLYLELHAKPRKKSWTQDQYTFDRHLAEWKNHRLLDISKADLQRLHAQIGTDIGKTTANRVRALLSTMWNVARDTGHWEGDNPVSAVKKFTEQERERYLREDELPNFFAQLDADDNQDFADYVRLSLFTGARQSNVLAMQWVHINLDRAEWTIPGEQFKSGKAQTVPLTAEALQVLRKRKENTESDWVFPGRGLTGHLTRPGKWWDRLLQRCGLSERLTMHDLRRTLGSWQAAGGASLLVIGKTLGHKDQRSTEVYSRLDTDPVKKSMAVATKAIADAAKPPPEQPDNLGPMKDTRLRKWIEEKIGSVRELAGYAANEEEAIGTSQGADYLQRWLDEHEDELAVTPRLLELVFSTGVGCGRTNERLGHYAWRKLQTKFRGQYIHKLVSAEIGQKGITLTAVRRNVAARLDLSLRSVQDHDKKYR